MRQGNPRVLGIDIGGTYTKIGLVERQGKVTGFKKIKTLTENGNLANYLESLVLTCRTLLSSSDAPVIGIGISLLGWLNEERTYTFFCMNSLALNGYNIRKLFEDEFQLPVILNEDLVAHNLAEFYWGSGRGVNRFLILVMGTGVGASMMIDGKPLKFTGGCAGDTGHVILRPGGPACSSGCRGCGEALIGTANIERLADQKYEHSPGVSEVIRLARDQDDPIAVEIMGEIGTYAGELLASLAPIFLPARIALAGGTARAGSVLLEAAKYRFQELVGRYHSNCARFSSGYYSGVDIVLGSIHGETGLLGSVVEFFQH